jgi:hypothetical protein
MKLPKPSSLSRGGAAALAAASRAQPQRRPRGATRQRTETPVITAATSHFRPNSSATGAGRARLIGSSLAASTRKNI